MSAQEQITPEAYQDQLTAAMRKKAIKAGKAASEYLHAVDDDGYGYDGDPAELDDFDAAPSVRAPFDPNADEVEIDFESDGRSRVINVRGHGGEQLRYEVPALTVDKLDRIEWYMGRYHNRTAEMHKAKDPQTADKFGAQRRRVQEDMLIYVVPEWVRGTTDKMPVLSFNKVWATVQSMSSEAVEQGTVQAEQGDDDPNF